MRAHPKLNRSALTAFLLAGLPAAAFAAPPAVLDRVPADADVVIAVREVNDFLGDLDQLNRVMGDNGNPQVTMAAALVRGMPGVDLDGSAVFVIDVPGDPAAGGEPTVVALVPVKDFAALTQGREAVDGLVQLPLPDAEVFARDIGAGYAVVSDNAEAARAYDATKGRLKAHVERIGASGGKVATDAEIAILLNADALRPILDQGLAGMKQQGEMVAMMGGEEAAVGFNAFASVATMVINDLNAGVFGATIDDQGMTYDMALQFKPDSKTAAYFERPGSVQGLLERLPDQPYMFAAALDTSSPTLAKVGKAFADWKATLPQAMQEQMAQSGFGQMSLADLNRMTSGVSLVMGSTPGLMGGGLFANTTYYIKSAQPGEYRDAVVSGLEKADGQAADGVAVETETIPQAITIDGTELTSYSVTIKLDPAAMGGAQGAMPGMDPAMITQMVFGPTGGPAGYLATVEGGVVQTMSQGPDLTRRALAAAKQGKGLGANARVARIGARLQSDRIAEIYVGADEILNAVGPMLMMFGAVEQFEPVQGVDPIALGLSTDAAGFVGRIHVPLEAFKTISEMIPDAPADVGGQGGDDQGFDF